MSVQSPLWTAALAAEPASDRTPIHGGDIYSASQRYGIPAHDWLDLSTGINPVPYPVGKIETSAFYRLPYVDPAFLQQASTYYGNAQLLPVAGTQAVIQALPQCLPSARILVPEVGYREHAVHWQKAGARLVTYPSFDQQEAQSRIEKTLLERARCHLLLINPNNPTGMRFSPSQIQTWARQLQPGCFLIVDEAFMDLTPQESVLGGHFSDNMIVLRSFGKFFGLAGIRLGFVFASLPLRQRLQQALGIWSVNGPAQSIAMTALADREWHQQARVQIALMADFTRQVFAPVMQTLNTQKCADGGLFLSYRCDPALARHLQHYLACHGILVRIIEAHSHSCLLRFGLLNPTDIASVERVNKTLAAYLPQRNLV